MRRHEGPAALQATPDLAESLQPLVGREEVQGQEAGRGIEGPLGGSWM